MTTLNIDDYPENLIPFRVAHMQSASTLWTDSRIIQRTHGYEINGHDFQKMYAYGVVGNENFEEIIFDINEVETVFAERYGGFGLSENGGGARCGNLHKAQIKGIGRNCLAGVEESWHSYGGLCLTDAVTEAIYSAVLDRFLPLGVVGCLGLIGTGKDTSYPPSLSGESETGPGALFIREKCLRPGHLLRNGLYQIPDELKTSVCNDIVRVRGVNQKLYKQLGGEKGFIRFMGMFMSNYANQFAFSRVHRLAHAALSPSNIAIDGRWIDLSTTCFVNGGTNYQASMNTSSFRGEPHGLYYHIEELVYTFAKYNGLKLNVTPFQNYHYGQFHAYYKKYCAEIFGFQEARTSDEMYRSVEYAGLVHQCEKILDTVQSPTVDEPTGRLANDPYLKLIKSCFANLHNNRHPFSRIFNYATANMGENESAQYAVSCMIRAFKKFYFTPFMYRTRIVNNVRRLTPEGETDKIGEYIQSSVDTAYWVLELDKNSEFILFKSTSKELRFCSKSNALQLINIVENTQQVFEDIDELQNTLMQPSGRSNFDIYDFNFLPGICAILEALKPFIRQKYNESSEIYA